MTKNIKNSTLRLAIHDPLQLNEQDFLNTFVARHKTLKRLTRHIHENTTAKLLQHRLIFGQRGMGKTSLLRRLALNVREDKSLAKHWLPLNFREEQYNIGKLDHFWLNCADVLADWCEKQDDTKSAELLDEAMDSEIRLYETIQKTAKKHNRRLLLLIDNLNLILDSLPKKDQWELREKLQSEDAPLVISCTPSHVAQLSDREGPFYDFFSIDVLKPLTQIEMRECLSRLAQVRSKPGEEVLKDIRRHPARIKVMHTLCGGNPRTMVLIYQVLETIVSSKSEGKSDIGQLLEGVLENTTPLYKARTEELPQQQRRVIDAIALQWDPAHSSTIAKMTGLTTNTLSSQLKRLQNDGLLQQVPLGPKRKGFQMTERFYNIWYLMRHGTRRNRLRLRWLSSFLSAYYSNDELHHQAKHLIKNNNTARNAYSEALMHSIDDKPLQNALRHELTRPLIEWDKKSIKNLIPGEDYEPKLLSHAARQDKLKKGLLKTGIDKNKIQQLTTLITESLYLPLSEKQKIADNAEQLSKKKMDQLLKTLNQEKQRYDNYMGKEANRVLRQAFANGKITSLDDCKGALTVLAYSENSALLDALLLMNIFKNADHEDIKRFAHACTATPPAKADSWNNLGILLQYHLQHFEESEQAYKKAIEIDPEYASTWYNLGNLLKNHLQRFEESEQAYKKAIRIDPEDAYPWNGLGNLLQDHLQRFEDSEHAFKKAIEIDPEFVDPWSGLGNLLQVHLQRFEESEQAYKKAIGINPEDADPWNGLGNLLQDHLQRFKESENAYLMAEKIDQKYQFPIANRAWLSLKFNDAIKARKLAENLELMFPGKELLMAGCELVSGNPGTCCDILEPVLKENPAILWINFSDDLLRLTRLFKQYNFEKFFVDFLHKKQLHITLEPYVAAAEAYFSGHDRLLLLNPEARIVAEPLYKSLISGDIKKTS